jgi:hypothetical protein
VARGVGGTHQSRVPRERIGSRQVESVGIGGRVDAPDLTHRVGATLIADRACHSPLIARAPGRAGAAARAADDAALHRAYRPRSAVRRR